MKIQHPVFNPFVVTSIISEWIEKAISVDTL
jgi:hypothetical protein